MPATLIRNVLLVDGSGEPPRPADVLLRDSLIERVGTLPAESADTIIDANGLALAPGFIDSHTHDDTAILHTPQMLPKLSQGVTTVIAGNCGISAAPVRLRSDPPDPMNLLGDASTFQYPTFASYVEAVHAARPAVNIAAFAGHTALRNNHMDRLDRTATHAEIAAMRVDLQEALDHGALGLSTGLAYLSAFSATTEEVLALAETLAAAGAIYATHLRSETEQILAAMDEAFRIGRSSRVPVVISHLKCAGITNWGRSGEVLARLDAASTGQTIGCDCYPYAAGSSTLDLRQVDERVKITITWSTPHPEQSGKTLAEIAAAWRLSHLEAAKRLQPAGAIYHSISESDMRAILSHPATMIGSDGLPLDPHPHPRLWGAFPRVLGRYSRDLGLFPLEEAVRKMTSLPAARFGLVHRGLVRDGYCADLVLFDPQLICDTATFEHPAQVAGGIESVWVNGRLSYSRGAATGDRSGKFIPRGSIIA
ncbi:N-acyl-D-amino-acid deacylase family protein [Acidipila rosea]|uniref:N-acyl-D-amino-acid deacylase n=1 Tax=Acidipila rosea TaxID=768535 RepID=A0A4V2PUV1_9BACT|nr:D-aminoacylase [Acidipila rosea]TCK71921.1 N-acyl-D-amino-acid deacylase [Acidipila rosea]